MQPEIESLLSTIDRCARCGKCRSVCPVFEETLDEKFVSRARINLAEAYLKGALKDIGELSDLWKTCIKCTRCSWICPSAVKGDEISLGIAALLASAGRDKGLASFFRSVVMNRSAFDSFMFAASRFQNFLPKKRHGMLRHMPLAILGKTELPTLARNPALHVLPRKVTPKHKQSRVALFLGCAINYVYPGTAKSMISILEKVGVETVIPSKQLCCGTPALAMGLAREARDLARHNSSVFQRAEVEAVVTGCASCALTLSRNYEVLGVKMPQVFEFSKYLTDIGYMPDVDLNRSVAYHDPCHLRYGLGIKDEPRALIAKIARLTEMESEDKCCGGGGSFSFFNPELSAALAGKKIEGAIRSNPDIIATTCPGCIMQLREQFDRAGLSTDVVHLADLLSGRTKE